MERDQANKSDTKAIFVKGGHDNEILVNKNIKHYFTEFSVALDFKIFL
jgi:hypothetical protein